MFKPLRVIVDILLVSLVFSLGFLTFSKSLGYPQYSSVVEGFVGGDEILHVLAGLILVLFFYQLSRFFVLRFIVRFFAALGLALLVLIADESLQMFNAFRVQSWSDFGFGCTGLVVGLGLIGCNYSAHAKICTDLR